MSDVTSEKTQLTARLQRTHKLARELLLARMKPEGYWEGRLSSSALSTATAVSAFCIAAPDQYRACIEGGIAWLAADQNHDGGWGDSPESPSNVPATMLVAAAHHLAASCGAAVAGACSEQAEAYLKEHAGATALERGNTLRRLYGKDRTFAVPILVNCALAPFPDETRIEWADVPGLPFELTLLPRSFFRWLRLHVVSYAMPALIAIGQLIHTKHPSRHASIRLIRKLAVPSALRRLQSIQPSSGGFLEAIPLTSFVTMSLAASGKSDHPVVRKALEFLEQLARPDGSWPIEANLSNWLTSLAVEALAAGDSSQIDPALVRHWLLARQHKLVHPYTDSPPGGWAWTHLSGGVPDADDTAAAFIALSHLGGDVSHAVSHGIAWLLGLQNRDGGWPTFCRGWGKLPFDRSAPDLTAHVLRALRLWPKALPAQRIRAATSRALRYLHHSQRSDGAWTAIWFGNQSAPQQRNPVYGTARVLAAYRDIGQAACAEALRGVEYLISAQNQEGSWGGDCNLPGSVEETALAVDALTGWLDHGPAAHACLRGAECLCKLVDQGGLERPAPIGLYFARLWYTEALYPIIWTAGALGRILGRMAEAG